MRNKCSMVVALRAKTSTEPHWAFTASIAFGSQRKTKSMMVQSPSVTAYTNGCGVKLAVSGYK